MKRGAGRPRQAGSQTEELYDSRTDESLDEKAKIYRDAFCREYIKDFHGSKALFRLGYTNAKSAPTRACQLLREPYVANRIHELVRQLQPTDIVTRGQVMAKLWEEANDYSNEGGVRVQATAHIAKMLGMMDKAKDESDAPSVGVMFVPCSGSPQEWEAAASMAQGMLKQRASALGAAHLPAPLPTASAPGLN